jgi:DNA mismatch endonuclease (patch repair protein)
MGDKVDRATRSRIMSRVRSRDTQLELTLRRALWRSGVRGWRCHVRSVYGTPDLCWKGRRVAVFVDSAWWHGHPSRWQPGRLPGKWDEKIAANRRRDDEVNERLAKDGWSVLRLWDFEIAEDLVSSVARVQAFLAHSSNTREHPGGGNPQPLR